MKVRVGIDEKEMFVGNTGGMANLNPYQYGSYAKSKAKPVKKK